MCQLPEFLYLACGKQLNHISEGVASFFAGRLGLQKGVSSEWPRGGVVSCGYYNMSAINVLMEALSAEY